MPNINLVLPVLCVHQPIFFHPSRTKLIRYTIFWIVNCIELYGSRFGAILPEPRSNFTIFLQWWMSWSFLQQLYALFWMTVEFLTAWLHDNLLLVYVYHLPSLVQYQSPNLTPNLRATGLGILAPLDYGSYGLE